jgi:lysophospholipase L1-like esterase
MESNQSSDSNLNKPELYLNGMSRTITRLERAGKKVVIFMDIPELNFSPIRCITRPLPLLAPENLGACTMKRTIATDYAAPYRAVIQELIKKHPNARLYDPTSQLCDQKYCYAGDKTMLFYHDPNHLSQRGSKKVMADFMDWLEKHGQ